MTPFQREGIDWHAKNRWTKEAQIERMIYKFLPWVCFVLGAIITVLIGAEILFHLVAFVRG